MGKEGHTPILIICGGSLVTNLWLAGASDVDIYGIHLHGDDWGFTFPRVLKDYIFSFTPSKVNFATERRDMLLQELQNPTTPISRKVYRYESFLFFPVIYEDGVESQTVKDYLNSIPLTTVAQNYLDAGDEAAQATSSRNPDKVSAHTLRLYLQGVKFCLQGLGSFETDARVLFTWANVDVNWSEFGQGTIDWQVDIDTARQQLVNELAKL